VIYKHKRQDSDVFTLRFWPLTFWLQNWFTSYTILSFSCFLGLWRRGVVVSAFGVSSTNLQLLYVRSD